MSGRKVFEYTAAGVITGVVIPSIYKEYKSLFNNKLKKVNVSIPDAIAMFDDEDEDDEDY